MGQFSGHLHGHGLLGGVWVVVTDEIYGDAGKHGKVEPLALLWGGVLVEPSGVAEKGQHQLDVLAHQLHVVLASSDQAASVVHLGHQGCLAWFQVFGGDGFVEVGVDELLLLAFQLNESLPLVSEQRLVVFLSGVEFTAGELPDFADGLGGELNGRVPDAFDFVFDFLDRDVGQVTAGAPGVTTEAEEIAVDTTLATGVAVAHSPTAAIAGQRSLEVVGVSPGPIAGDASPGEDVLHEVPGLLVNEWLVGTVVNDAAVANLPHVVGVAQHPVDLRVIQRGADVLQR